MHTKQIETIAPLFLWILRLVIQEWNIVTHFSLGSAWMPRIVQVLALAFCACICSGATWYALNEFPISFYFVRVGFCCLPPKLLTDTQSKKRRQIHTQISAFECQIRATTGAGTKSSKNTEVILIYWKKLVKDCAEKMSFNWKQHHCFKKAGLFLVCFLSGWL